MSFLYFINNLCCVQYFLSCIFSHLFFATFWQFMHYFEIQSIFGTFILSIFSILSIFGTCMIGQYFKWLLSLRYSLKIVKVWKSVNILFHVPAWEDTKKKLQKRESESLLIRKWINYRSNMFRRERNCWIDTIHPKCGISFWYRKCDVSK